VLVSIQISVASKKIKTKKEFKKFSFFIFFKIFLIFFFLLFVVCSFLLPSISSTVSRSKPRRAACPLGPSFFDRVSSKPLGDAAQLLTADEVDDESAREKRGRARANRARASERTNRKRERARDKKQLKNKL